MKFKIDPKAKSAIKSYLRAVAASAVTMGISLLLHWKPEYAVLIGAITAPAVKWADKSEREFGRVSDSIDKLAKADKKKAK